MKNITRCLVIAMFLAVSNTYATERIPEGYTVAKTMPEAITLAKQGGKKGVLVYFYLNRCTSCNLMETLLERPEIKSLYARDFVLMSMHKKDSDEKLPKEYQDLSEREMFGLYGMMYPSMGIVDINGKKVCKQESPFTCRAAPEEKMAKKFHEGVLKMIEAGNTPQDKNPPMCVAVPAPGDC